MARSSGRRGRHSFLLAVVWACPLLALSVFAAPARADSFWVLSSNSGSGSWFNTNNWSSNKVPGSNTNAFIDNGGTALISTNSATVRAITIGQTAAFATNTLSITGGLLTVNSNLILGDQINAFGQATVSGGSLGAGQDIIVGNNGTGLLNITNGGSVTNNRYVYLGNGYQGNGTVNVSGTGSTWNMSSWLYVGYMGTGTINITSGGSVTNNLATAIGYYSSGTVNVSGAGSTWVMANSNGSLEVGDFGGTSIVNITNGGIVTSCAPVYVGNGGAGTVNVSGPGSSMVLSAPGYYGLALTISQFGSPGQLNITNGASVSVTGRVWIGRDGNGGTVSVFGPGSKLVLNMETVAHAGNGLAGSGTLNITDGGSVINNSDYISVAAINVSGAGSTFALLNTNSELRVGYATFANSGTGTLNITGGGSVTSTGVAYLGSQTNWSATANVSGAGSIWALPNTNGFFYIGRYGTGLLNLTNGGSVTDNGYAYLGYYGSGTVNVSGTGSTWVLPNSNGFLRVGYGGTGLVNITNGGSVANNGYVYLGYSTNGSGTVNVSGASSGGGGGSTWAMTSSNANLYVGYHGTGIVSVTNGGTVTCATNAYLGYYPGSTGTVYVADTNSTWGIGGSLYVGGNDTNAGGSAVLTVGAGASVNVPTTVTVWSGGTVNLSGGQVSAPNWQLRGGTVNVSGVSLLTATGALNGFGQITGPVFLADSASLVLGNATNITTLKTGDLTLSPLTAVTMKLDQAGVPGSLGGSDLVVVNGNLSLSGQLAVADGAQFGVGRYRLFNYVGQVTNNTMVVSALSAGYTGKIDLSTTGQVNLVVGLSTNIWLWQGQSGKQWDFTAANWAPGGSSPAVAYVDGADVYFDDTGTNTAPITLMTNVAPGSVRVSNSVLNYQLAGPGSITGTTTLVKRGMGALSIANVNTYTGDTEIHAGTVWVATNQALGSGPSMVILGSAYGTDNASMLAASGITIDRNVVVRPGSAGMFTLGGGNTNGTAVFTGTLTLQNALTLTAAPGGTVDFQGALDNSAGQALTKSGAGTVILSGPQNHGLGAVVNVAAGTLQLNSDAGAGGANLSVYTSGPTASLLFNTNQNLAALDVGGGNALSLSPTSPTVTAGLLMVGNQTGSVGTVGVSAMSLVTTGQAIIGNYGTGTANTTDGGRMTNNGGVFLGYYSNSTGTVNVSGAGSTLVLTSSIDELNVGACGTGVLNITSGGSVTNYGYANLGFYVNGSGTVTVSGPGSTWAMPNTNGSLTVALQGMGSLNITRGGSVTSQGAVTEIGGLPGTLGTVNVSGAGSTWIMANTNASLWLGYYFDGTGVVNVTDGGRVTSSWGAMYLGAGKSGTINVSGAGSTWTMATTDAVLYVGYGRTGIVNVTNGGALACAGTAYVGYYAGSHAAAYISDSNSTFTVGGTLFVGVTDPPAGGTAILTVGTGAAVNVGHTITLWSSGAFNLLGGQVTAQGLMATDTPSTLRLHVRGNDMLVLGNAGTNGSITNNGSVNLYADAFLPGGVYTPISAYPGRTLTWSGTGAYNAFGGVWDGTAHTLTVTAPTAATAGDTDAVTTGERLLFTDPASGKHVGASFGSVTNGTTFAAVPMTDAELAGLAATPGYTGSVLAGWDFVATNFAGGPVFLSFDGGAGPAWAPMEARDLTVWHLQGGTWTPFAADFVTYDPAGVVSFPVSSFSGYAVTAPGAVVPEPGSLVLLGLGTMVIFSGRRRRKAG